MKKIIIALSMLFTVMIPLNATAADQKALVIIDSYFDNRATGANIVCTPTINCSTTAKLSTSVSDNTNHGDAMIEVAKKQGAINIIALRSGATPTSDVNAGNFIEALQWVNNNSSTIGAVSFSRFFNGTTTCSPASANTANYGGVAGADLKIKSLIVELKNKGIPVFASTGNNGKTGKINYPACILDTASVTANNYTLASSDNNTDYVGTLPSGVYAYIGTIKWSTNTLIPQTTSSATAAVAAKYVLGNLLTKTVSIDK